MDLWRQSREGLGEYDVLYRNLGLGAWQQERDAASAIRHLERALELNPRNQDLYLLLDELYKAAGLPQKRRNLLERIGELADLREDLRKRRIAMMVDLGDHEQALRLLAAGRFLPLEMDQSFHDVYVAALRLRAEEHLQAGDLEAAIQDYRGMLEYPAHLGVGAPTTRTQARIYYQLGLAYEKLGQYREAIQAWSEAAREHHARGHALFPYIQMALDKLGRYSELGLEP
jgi:tetratricopeptide (TPR) repeat protein